MLQFFYMKPLVRLGFFMLILLFFVIAVSAYEFFELETIHMKLIPERSRFAESLFHQSIEAPFLERINENERELVQFDITVPAVAEESLRVLE
ncbi:hypothetical protein PVA44_04800 [Entomospira nematocerorum]|uniref:Uncharacterized protein n=1 Tax=Entomospira nematocerorum TaxID=2719987 RepID=A0A968GF69_9SPIO|nr:hypothetical protein [Entomospira nematocera]NIZ46661.1 hypothetical protein [Entomospira nematocera]WDI33542.1 hypothetical protein PVA44_04800 [Entomospira nematocera]